MHPLRDAVARHQDQQAASIAQIAGLNRHLFQRQHRGDVYGLRGQIEQHHGFAPRGQQGGGLAADQPGAGDQRAQGAAAASPSLKTR